MTAEAMREEISTLTSGLIESGLCIDQNYPTLKHETGGISVVGFSGPENLAITLKNVPYSEAYQQLTDQRSYNLRLVDGGIVQMLYTFSSAKMLKHRLAFFPCPNLLEYQNNSEIYETDTLYADVIDRNIVSTPLRFDFDRGAFIDYEHPMSHLTIGQYKHCRIPVNGAISPYIFLNFILRAFYNTPFREFCSGLKEYLYTFEDTITNRERQHMHLRACDVRGT